MQRFQVLPTLALLGLALGATACKEASAAKVSGVGDSLQAFIIKNCATKEAYCQVCAYGGKPTIMTIGTLDDEGFEKDLVRIQAIVDKHQDKKLTAFALLGDLRGARLEPFGNEADALEKIDAMSKRLGLSFPVVIIPSGARDQQDGYPEFNEAYAVKAGRTVHLAKADNKVVFSELITDARADEQFDKLEKAAQAL